MRGHNCQRVRYYAPENTSHRQSRKAKATTKMKSVLVFLYWYMLWWNPNNLHHLKWNMHTDTGTKLWTTGDKWKKKKGTKKIITTRYSLLNRAQSLIASALIKFQLLSREQIIHCWRWEEYSLDYSCSLKVVYGFLTELRIDVVCSKPLNHRNVRRKVPVGLSENSK